MTDMIVSFFSGAFGGALTWLALDFFQRPFRGFFDLKKESIQVLARYSNVSARSKQMSPDDDLHHARPLNPEEEVRLREAEAALRDCGAKFLAFSRTEKMTLMPLRWIGYDPAKVGSNFIGLSNSIGQYGSHRNHYRTQVERSLKVTG